MPQLQNRCRLRLADPDSHGMSPGETGWRQCLCLVVRCVLGAAMAVGAAASCRRDGSTGQDPDLASVAHLERGRSLRKRGRYREAIAEFDKAIQLDPNWAMPYCSRGMAHHQLSEHDQAIADLTKAVELAPQYAIAYGNRGFVHREIGELEKAIADYTEAIRLDPEFATAYADRGLMHFNTGKYAQAVADCTEAIRLRPGLARAYASRGLAHAKVYKLGKAIADCTRAIELEPKNAEFRANRAVLYFWRVRDVAKAWVDVRACQALGGELPPAFLEALRQASETQGVP